MRVRGWLFAKPMPADELDRWLAAPKSWETDPPATTAVTVLAAPCAAPASSGR